MENNFTYKFEELDPNKYYIIYLEIKDKSFEYFGEMARQIQNTFHNKGLKNCIIAPMYNGEPEIKAMDIEKNLAPILNEMGYDLIKRPEPISKYQVKNLGKNCYVIADMEDRGLFLRDSNNNLIKFTNKTEAYEYCYALNAQESVHD